MNTKFLYDTVANAINSLRSIGFNNDFSLEETSIVWKKTKFDTRDLRIVALFRYEGDSDPADRASVYGLESKRGLKGILITNDDANSEASSRHILKKLHFRFLSSGKIKNNAKDSSLFAMC